MTDLKENLHTEHMVLNMGPSHPATHGTVKFLLTLDGETVVDMIVEVGYLHRGFEKMCESVTYTNVFPYTDRLNYCSAIMNNIGYALAVEKLCGIEVSDRCAYIRVVTNELMRIADHYTNIAAAALELGALTAFIYFVETREIVWDLLEKVCGARLTSNYIRIGGVKNDVPDDFRQRMATLIPELKQGIDEGDRLLSFSEIFLARTKGIGVIDAETAIANGMSGPSLRASGVPMDVRKDDPYSVYDRFDFGIPIGEKGDSWDRYYVRVEEMRQHLHLPPKARQVQWVGPNPVEPLHGVSVNKHLLHSRQLAISAGVEGPVLSSVD